MRVCAAARFKRYGITVLAGAIVSGLIAWRQGFAFENAIGWNVRHLSDGFFVAGLLLMGMGGLQLVSTTGFFDMLSYGFRSLLVLFSPLKKASEHPRFYDYKVAKDERRTKAVYYPLVTGVVFLGLSLLCLALYYRV